MGEKKTDRKAGMETLLHEISKIFEATPLQSLRSSVLDLREKLRKDEVRLAVLGQMKRGKSSLLNSLLGDNILPTGVLPLTSVVTEIRYAAIPKAIVLQQNGSPDEIAFSEIPEYVTEAKNPGNRKRILGLDILYPSDLLQDGLVLVDTPGFGSTYSHNTAATSRYLTKVDAAIVVFSVDPPITEVEASFIRDIRKEIPKLFFVLNKIDLVSDQDVQAACEFLRDELANRLGLTHFDVFPLTTRARAASVVDDASSSGLGRFMEHLRHFAKYGHDETLFLSVLRDAGQLLDLASFSLSISRKLSSLNPSEVKEKQKEIHRLLEDAARDTAAIRTLLHEGRLELMKKIGADLEMHVKVSTPYLEARLLSLQQENPHSSGRALGRLIEDFFNREMHTIFRDWRMQEDAQLSTMLVEIVSRNTERANSILNALAAGIGSLVDLPPMNLKISCGLAMDSRVRYSIERVFYSLDSFFLAIPPFLQRPLVFRRVRATVASRLDGNSGRIRFDYLERMERTFRDLEQSLTSQIEDARKTLVQSFEEPCFDVSLWRDVQSAKSCVSLMSQ